MMKALYLSACLLWTRTCCSAESMSTTGIRLEADVPLLLEPSSTQVQALIIYLEAPGQLDLSRIQLSYPTSLQDGTRTSTPVQYAVAPVEFVNANLPTNTIQFSYCDEKGCDFTPDTEWIVELGIGSRSSNDTYQWCSTNDSNREDFPFQQQNSGNLIRDTTEPAHTVLGYESMNIMEGMQKSPKYGKFVVEDPMESGYYAILFANCQDTHGHTIQVRGTLIWDGQETRELSSVQAILAPLLLVGILGFVYYIKEKEGRSLFLEDSYNASARNAGYSSLPMMDLSTNR